MAYAVSNNMYMAMFTHDMSEETEASISSVKYYDFSFAVFRISICNLQQKKLLYKSCGRNRQICFWPIPTLVFGLVFESPMSEISKAEGQPCLSSS